MKGMQTVQKNTIYKRNANADSTKEYKLLSLLFYGCRHILSDSLREESQVQGLSRISSGMPDYRVLFLAVA